jgi:hypothetical protein
MSDIATRRKLLEQTQFMVRANNTEQRMKSFAAVINTLGELISIWTGEQARVQITAVGQAESVDMANAGIPTELMAVLCKAQADHEKKGGCPGCGSMVYAVHNIPCPATENDLY